jgi:phage-related protein
VALEIFKLVGSVFVDTEKANESLNKSDKKAESFGSKLLTVGKNAGIFVSAVAGAAGVVGGAMAALDEKTREYREEQGKLLTAFETSGFAAGEAKKTYSELNGVLGDSGQAVEAANHLAKLCTNAGELANWTNICTGVYATFGDSLPIEGLTEAANETAKTGSLTGALADALNWAGVNEDSFQASLNACNSEQERQALITDTLNGLYSTAADNYRDVNGELIASNQAQDKLNATMAKAGAAVAPLITQGKQLLADVLTRAVPYIEMIAGEAIPVLTTVIQSLGPVVGSVFQGIGWLWNTVGKPVFNGILMFIEGVFTGNFTKAFRGLVNILSGVFGGLVGVVKVPLNKVIGLFNSFIRGLNKLRIPSWVPGVGGKGINIPRIPLLAEGGVLARGQIGLLEGHGAEAVVPLEKNKKWISAVARDMQSAVGGASGGQVAAILMDILALLEKLAEMGIYLDTGALVGGLAKPMDKKLGQIQAAKARG